MQYELRTRENGMRRILLAAALALGFGLATTGAQAATLNTNLATVDTVAKSGHSLVEKTYYHRRYWRHRYYWRHRHHYWRPYYRRHYWWRHHHRHYYWRHRHHYWR
jgi:hypothetical protein